jgi:hypothetical protein
MKGAASRLTLVNRIDVVRDTVNGTAIDASFKGYSGSAMSSAASAGPFTSWHCISSGGPLRHLRTVAGADWQRGRITGTHPAKGERAGRSRHKVLPRVDPRHFALDDMDVAHLALSSLSSGKILVDIDTSRPSLWSRVTFSFACYRLFNGIILNFRSSSRRWLSRFDAADDSQMP